MNSDQIIVLFKEKTIRRTWANAVRARFFGSLKSERTNNMNHLTREEAKTEVINYTALLYNSERLHSTFGYLTPLEHENENQILFKKVSRFT